MYTIRVPRSGWRRDKIEEGKSWERNLAAPRIIVRQPIDDRRQLCVALIEVGGQDGPVRPDRVEVEGAVIEEWKDEPEAEAGGYWHMGPEVSPRQIQLVP